METIPNNTDVQEPKEESVFKRHKGTLYSVALFASAFIAALLINAFIFQPYEVEGSSMEPTLQNSDRLIVSKTGKTWSNITRNDYIPERGEIVVFKSSRLGKQLIKRVIALPGERVVVKDGIVTVYNSDNPNGFSPDTLVDVDFFEATLGNIDKEVTEGSIFVLGDNRLPNASQDSRSFGLINSEDIIGTLSFRMYPFNKLSGF